MRRTFGTAGRDSHKHAGGASRASTFGLLGDADGSDIQRTACVTLACTEICARAPLQQHSARAKTRLIRLGGRRLGRAAAAVDSAALDRRIRARLKQARTARSLSVCFVAVVAARGRTEAVSLPLLVLRHPNLYHIYIEK